MGRGGCCAEGPLPQPFVSSDPDAVSVVPPSFLDPLSPPRVAWTPGVGRLLLLQPTVLSSWLPVDIWIADGLSGGDSLGEEPLAARCGLSRCLLSKPVGFALTGGFGLNGGGVTITRLSGFSGSVNIRFNFCIEVGTEETIGESVPHELLRDWPPPAMEATTPEWPGGKGARGAGAGGAGLTAATPCSVRGLGLWDGGLKK